MLRSAWNWIRPQRKTREVITLDPVEQLVIRYLTQFGARTREGVYTEVNSTRAVTHADVEEALARLASQDLIDSRFRLESDQSETLFSPSKKATRLKGRIPMQPQTVTDFYL